MNKRVFRAIAASMLLMVGMNATVYATSMESLIEELQWQIQEAYGQSDRPQDAKLALVSDEIMNFSAGDNKDITVTVKNIGDRVIRDVSVKASLGGSDAPIAVELAKGSATISNLSGNGTKNLTLRVKANSTAEAGVYPIKLSFTYRNNENKITSEELAVYIRIASDTATPELVIKDFSSGATRIQAGDDFTLTATLQNAGKAEAKDIQVLVDGVDSEKIYLSGASNNLYFSTLRSNGTQNLSFSLSANEDIKSGSYPLVFNIKYRDNNNEAKESSYTYYVNVSGSKDSTDRAYLEITGMPTLTKVYDVAEEFTVTFDLINTGITAAKNIKVSAVTDSDGALVPKSADRRSIIQLEPGASTRLSYRFAPTSKASTQNYVISFKVDYETGVKTDNVEETSSFEQFIGVNVFNPDKEDETEEDKAKISKPKIIIDSYRVEPMIVKAGQEFDITMVFKNTHPTKAIENIKAVLTPNEATENSGSVFMPVDGSNTFYISSIAPGGTATENFRMYAIPAADPRTYTITVEFRYQDADYNEYVEDEIIGVTVKQTTKLDTGNIMVQTEGSMFQPIYVNFNLMNTGKSTLNNLTVEIQGDGFDVSKSFMYFGSLNKSGSSYYDGEITPQQPGNQAGKVIISYEDEAGEVTTIERDFVINVLDSEPMMDMGMEFPMGMEGMDGMNGGGSIQDRAIGYAKNPLVWVGIVCVGAAAFFGKKFYDKKRRPQFDE